MCFLFLLHLFIITNADERHAINIFKIMRESLDVLHFFEDLQCWVIFLTVTPACIFHFIIMCQILSGFTSLLSSVILKILDIGSRCVRVGKGLSVFHNYRYNIIYLHAGSSNTDQSFVPFLYNTYVASRFACEHVSQRVVPRGNPSCLFSCFACPGTD